MRIDHRGLNVSVSKKPLHFGKSIVEFHLSSFEGGHVVQLLDITDRKQLKETAGGVMSSDEAGYLPRGEEIVLIAEDEPSVSNFITRILKKQGYREILDREECFLIFSSDWLSGASSSCIGASVR